jgi:glutamyl-tRNA synthetase
MKGDTPAPALEAAIHRLAEVASWTAESVEGALRSALEDTELNPRRGWQPLRVAVTGSPVSPPLFESMAAIGKETTIARLNRALRVLETA